jgi:DNA-binding transcriptional LysR family regulator
VILHSLDLNLLVTLDALLQERSVTRAAQRLGVSQPAISASLARLRRHFGDELLSRAGNSYHLSPLAVQLKQRTPPALAGVERVFHVNPEFDPSQTTREFTIMCSDYGMVIFGSVLAVMLKEAAPRARLRFEHAISYRVDAARETWSRIDAILLPHGFIVDMPFQDVYRDEFMCVVDRDNPRVGEALTTEDLMALPWVLTYHAPSAFTSAARQMRMLDIEPYVEIVTESFAAVPAFVIGSERITLMQGKLARRLAEGTTLRVLPCPFDAVPLVEALWWHPMYDRDPEHRWFRDLVQHAGREVDKI